MQCVMMSHNKLEWATTSHNQHDETQWSAMSHNDQNKPHWAKISNDELKRAIFRHNKAQ